MHKKLGEKCRSKANDVVLHVRLVSRYFTTTTIDLPAHAWSRHVPCDMWLVRLLFVWERIQSRLHLMNLMVFKSQKSKSQRNLSQCFCWFKSKREHNNHICQTHPFWRVSQKSSNLRMRKGEQLVERQRVKDIFRPLYTARKYSFRDLTLHSTSCHDCDLTGILFLKCVRLIFNTAPAEIQTEPVVCVAVFS